MVLLRAFGRRRVSPGGWAGVWGLVWALCLAHGGGVAAQSAPTPEYRLKAIFLFLLRAVRGMAGERVPRTGHPASHRRSGGGSVRSLPGRDRARRDGERPPAQPPG